MTLRPIVIRPVDTSPCWTHSSIGKCENKRKQKLRIAFRRVRGWLRRIYYCPRMTSKSLSTFKKVNLNWLFKRPSIRLVAKNGKFYWQTLVGGICLLNIWRLALIYLFRTLTKFEAGYPLQTYDNKIKDIYSKKTTIC